MTVTVVTDSSACVPGDAAADLGVRVVPITVTFGDRSVPADQVDRRELLERVEAGENVTTSAPSPGAFLEAIEAADGDGVVVVTLAGTMSTTNRSATLAAQQAATAAHVVDSGTAAGGTGLVVLDAARRAAAGASLDDVRDRARSVAGRVRLLAVVGSLEHLARSGRVPELAQRAGDALGIRPLFEFRQGQPKLLRPSLSQDAALERLAERVREDAPAGGRLHVSVLHGDRPRLAERLMEMVTDGTEPATAFVSEFDAAMLVHTGPELIGVAWWWETD